MYCENCGCKMSNGLCSNCQEEAYILENQSEYIDYVSDDFAEKAKHQFEKRKKHHTTADIRLRSNDLRQND